MRSVTLTHVRDACGIKAWSRPVEECKADWLLSCWWWYPLNIFWTLTCSFSISYKYPWTIGAAYPTTVPHSQSHAAGSPAHLDPACQSHSTYPALCHGVPPRREVGGLGWQHYCWGDGAACPRPHPGKRLWTATVTHCYTITHTRRYRDSVSELNTLFNFHIFRHAR